MASSAISRLSSWTILAVLLTAFFAAALRHTPAGGIVMLALQRDKNHVVVQVRDDGEGISQTNLPHIFERSYRAQNRRDKSDQSGSAGLGFAIEKRIVELHGSQLQVESALGKGATFSFDLPFPELLQHDTKVNFSCSFCEPARAD